jgi:hypothetical protein
MISALQATQVNQPAKAKAPNVEKASQTTLVSEPIVSERAQPIVNAIGESLQKGPNVWVPTSTASIIEENSQIFQRGLSGATYQDSYRGNGVREFVKLMAGRADETKRSVSVGTPSQLNELTGKVTSQYANPFAIRGDMNGLKVESGMSDEHKIVEGVGRDRISNVALIPNRVNPIEWANSYVNTVKIAEKRGFKFEPGSRGETFNTDLNKVLAERYYEEQETIAGRQKVLVNQYEIEQKLRGLYSQYNGKEPESDKPDLAMRSSSINDPARNRKASALGSTTVK